jgi:3-mercaptopyruvate sulfurtransferase SseA
MNPFEIWWAWYVYWMMTLYQPDEVRALRNLQNSNVVRLDRIEKKLREQGI